MPENNRLPTLLTIGKTAIKADPAVLLNVLGLWGTLTAVAGWERPQRPWSTRLFVGALATLTWLIADFGHAIAHIFSARAAAAPMDEIRISWGMPRTIYYNNDVSPRTHRMRALGGPIFSALGLAITLLVRTLSQSGSLAHEVASHSAIGHGFIFGGCLMPFPIVDGGTILKWTLVENGRTPAAADEIVQKAGLATSAAAAGSGAVLATFRHNRLPGLGLIAAGFLGIGIALRKIR